MYRDSSSNSLSTSSSEMIPAEIQNLQSVVPPWKSTK